MEIDYATVGLRIRGLRVKMGLSQEALAEQADLSPTYISHIERAEKKPSLSALIRLAAALGVTLDFILAGSQPADTSAYMADVQSLLENCSLTERRIVLKVALATKEALCQAGVAS